MPRRSKGPRLYLRTGRRDARTGRLLPDLYYIRDGSREVGTGCGPDSLRDAEKALARYIAEKWKPAQTRAQPNGDPARVLVADVLALYATERAPELADPVSTAGRIETLVGWWGGRTLADVNRTTCRAYVEHRVTQPRKAAKTEAGKKRLITPQGARRELEDLSAAIGYWDEEHHLAPRPKVVMPDKLNSPRDALTRGQAAALIKAARGQKRDADGRWRRLPGLTCARRAHMARLLMIGFYTGTRPGVIMQLLWRESPHQAWVDLEKSMIYRRGKAERETAKRRPVARMPARLAAHLRRWARIDAVRSRMMAEKARRKGEPVPEPIASVIHYGGRPIQSARGSFEAIVADAGLSAAITPHWLRHTAATWLMEAGADPWAASAYMGMTMETLERHYGHQRPTYQAQVAASSRRSKTA